MQLRLRKDENRACQTLVSVCAKVFTRTWQVRADEISFRFWISLWFWLKMGKVNEVQLF